MSFSRVLVIGSGSAARRHVQFASRFLPQASVASMSQFGNIDFNTLVKRTEIELKEFNPDLIIIANASVSHLDSFLKVSNLNADIVIEKPLAADLEDAKTFQLIESRGNHVVFLNYQLRFSESLNYIKSIFDLGSLGDLIFADISVGQNLPSWRTVGEYEEQVSARKSLGGGVLNELSHEIDYCLWLFGHPDELNSHIAKISTLDIDVEDFATLFLKYSEEHEKAPGLIRITLDMFSVDRFRTMTLRGALGSLRWDGVEGKVEVFQNGDNTWREVFKDVSTPHENFWKFVSSGLVERRENAATIQDGLRVSEIIHSCKSEVRSDFFFQIIRGAS